MNVHLPLLSLITFIPLLGVLLILTARGSQEDIARSARATALWASGTVFLLSLWLLAHFDPQKTTFQFVESKGWLHGLGVDYRMGVDGISIWFVLLCTFLTPVCIIASWESVVTRVREYMCAFLILETMMIGTFCALDLVTFYIFFEGVLIPMFLIIGIWGGAQRIYSAFKFFLYTLLGSVLMLVAMLAIYAQTQTTDITVLLETPIDPGWQTWLWLAFFASFAVKLPMWPFHTWLPDAHVEAPTAGSVILAGVLLKMGGYGFLRFSLPMFPQASELFAPLVYALSVIAIIYTSLVALAQQDIKKLIAYSSVAHMGFVTIGIFSANVEGVQGAIFQMLSHGIISAALFLCVGVIYERVHSRAIADYGGLAHRMPAYAFVFMVLAMGAVGLPGTGGFVGEFLSLVGAYQVSSVLAFFAAIGIILAAVYMLHLYRRIFFGPLTNRKLQDITDLKPREIWVFAPLLLLVIWMGIVPGTVLDMTAASVENLVNGVDIAPLTSR